MAVFMAGLPQASMADVADTTVIGKSEAALNSDVLTPEILWAMGRIGSFTVSPDGKQAVYTVTYYSVEQNKSHTVIYLMDLATKSSTLLTRTAASESDPCFIQDGKKIAYLAEADGLTQIWAMNLDGTGRQQLSRETSSVNGFAFSPDGKKVLLVKNVPNRTSIQENDADLPLASGMVINDLMYKHWDHYTTEAPHPFVADFEGTQISGARDLLEGTPYESPMLPFGGMEQLAWSPDSKYVAYTCRKKVGKEYAISTDSDIYLYEVATGKRRTSASRRIIRLLRWTPPVPLKTRPLIINRRTTTWVTTRILSSRPMENILPGVVWRGTATRVTARGFVC